MTYSRTPFIFATLLALALVGNAAVVAEEHPPTHAETQELTLNQGQKWTADAHTFAAAQTMTGLVNAVPAKATVKDLRLLGSQLHEELQSLIRGCTMTGPAHDQLHTWIEAFSPDLQKLINAQDVSQGRAALTHVKHHLQAFEEHFQLESSK